MSREKRMMNRKKSNMRNSKDIEKNPTSIKEHVTNIVGNKKLLTIMIVSLITIITLLSTSFAMLMKSDSSEKEEIYNTGDLTVTLDKESEGKEIDINLAKPISDEYAVKTIEPYTFTINNTGTTYASYEVYLNETITNTNELSDDEVRKYIRYQIDEESPRSLASQGSNIIVRGGIESGDTLTFKLKLWISIDASNKMEGTEYRAVIGVKGKATNRMQPNGPEIVDGLIPVVYDETKESWIKADTSTSWYNYEKQEWANAVTVTSNKRETYLLASVGTTIQMNDINSMWVWIPRYKYRIPDHIGIGTSTPPEIDVIFESRYKNTGVKESIYRSSIQENGTIDDTLNDGEKIYYTHPAFIDGTAEGNYNETEYDIGGWDRELTGIWVGKFETGETITEPVIKPDLKAIYGSVSSQFSSSLIFANGVINNESGDVIYTNNDSNAYGLNTINNKTNSRMMKNTEWGMVTYLSQSKYGKMGNSNYNESNKEVYFNNSLTGRSSGSPIDNSNIYSYDGKICSSNTCDGVKNAESFLSATGASTSGTIYGIYDMNGGRTELLMGNVGNIFSTFNVQPSNHKYYDLYSSSPKNKKNTILGDATWETINWYSDSFDSNQWSNRGGYTGITNDSVGIFYGGHCTGGSDSNCSSRTVLIP